MTSGLNWLTSASRPRGRLEVWWLSIRDRWPRNAHLFGSFRNYFFADRKQRLSRNWLGRG